LTRSKGNADRPPGDSGREALERPGQVRQAVLSRPALRQRLREIAEAGGESEKDVLREADACLRELVPYSSALGYRLLIAFSRFVYRRGYDREITCDPAEIERFRELVRNHPIALVGNHRSQVDGFAMYCAMHDNGLPHPYTFGGINMKLPVMGTLLKGSKLIFIRRKFGDQPVYKEVLRAYIDFLVENRFPLFWAIEGTRSRTGKLSAPRFGLVSWVVDAQHRAHREDLYLVPVAASYEQIRDVQSYANEQRGFKKKPESFRWLVKYLAGFKHNMGKITVRFGEGVSLRQQMDHIRQNNPEILDIRDKVVLKLAIAACRGLNSVTPATITSLICLVLLQAAPRAVKRTVLEREFLQLRDYVKANGWPATFELDGDCSVALQLTLDSLDANEVIECYDRGPEPVYSIRPGKNLSASYYRNNSIHFFVAGAIAELALSQALAQRKPGDRKAAFWDEVSRLRNLFKFEFYFPEMAELQDEIRADLDLRCPGWRQLLASPDPSPGRELNEVKPLLCHGVFEPLAEAYQLVADRLMQMPDGEAFSREDFVARCLADGEQLHRLGHIRHQESVAKSLFETGLVLAGSRGLLEGEGDPSELRSGRNAFREEVSDLSLRLQAIRHIAATRRSA